MSKRMINSARAAALVVVLSAPAVHAADEVNLGPAGVALHGYDPVAYFDPGQPARGTNSVRSTHDGVTYWFSSAANKTAFDANPAKYVPAYGGWCSYGVRVGRKFDIDPNAFRIADGRLFVQLDLGTQKVWEQDRVKNIEIADRLWPNIASAPAASLGP